MSHLVTAPIVACFGALLASSFDPPSTVRAAQPGFRITERANTPTRHHDAVEEVTLFCGAKGGTSLAPGLGDWAVDGPLTQRTIDWCVPCMAVTLDHEVIFSFLPGAADALLGMGASFYEEQLAQLADTLRTNIPGAKNAFWVQTDMPGDLVDFIDGAIGNGTNMLEAQNSVASYLPYSGAVTMFDLPTYDGRYLDAGGLRVLGARMGFVSRR